MAIEAVNFSKATLDDELAAIDAIKRADLPTKMIGGKLRPVHEGNYKRKLGKQAEQTHREKLAALVVAPVIAAGYPDAVAKTKKGKTVIYHDGLPEVL